MKIPRPVTPKEGLRGDSVALRSRPLRDMKSPDVSLTLQDEMVTMKSALVSQIKEAIPTPRDSCFAEDKIIYRTGGERSTSGRDQFPAAGTFVCASIRPDRSN